jgi:hypothetical protein
MPRTKISEFSATPGDNTDIDGIDIAEGCAPSGINNAIRELMAQLKDMQTGASGDTFTLTTVNSTTVDTTNLEVTNLKAKDGTAAGSIANSTGVVTLASSVLTTTDINGGTVDGAAIGASSPSTAAFTTVSATGAITSTLATGTAPLVIASTTKVANLNVDQLDGADWAAPAALGSTTPAAGSFTTLTSSANFTPTSYTETITSSGTVGASATLAITAGTILTATLTSATACTFTMPTATAGKSFTLLLKQPASGTATTATFTGVKWGTIGAPTITATVGKLDILAFIADGTNWYGTASQGYTY